VELGDAVIDAVAEFGFIEAGTPVRVVQVDGMRSRGGSRRLRRIGGTGLNGADRRQGTRERTWTSRPWRWA
jgi:hypothetical protein